MADKSGKVEKGDFTTRDMEIMAKAWTCMEEAPKIDFDKLAEALGMSNVRSASNAWANIKKKIMAKGGISDEKANGDGGENGDATPKAKAKATPKRKKAAVTTGADDAEDGASPTKKAKSATTKTPRGKKSKGQSEIEEEDALAKEEGSEEGEIRED